MDFHSVRLTALAVLTVACIASCYADRLRASGSDGGTVDATVLDARVRDAHTDPPDARPPLRDAGFTCPLARADFTCLPTFRAYPERPFILPLAFDTCACCPRAECAVDVDTSSHTLRLTSTLCADPCDCTACNTPVADCDVPGLEAADWLVEVNGGAAYRLPVMEGSGREPAPPACVAFAEVDACTGAMTLDGAPQRASSTCVRPSAFFHGYGYSIEVTESCGTCDHESTCTVRLERRSTFEFPPGGDLYVAPLRFQGACDGPCDAVCMEHVRRCEAPALDPGQYYRVFVDGVVQLSFTAGTDTDVCTSAAGG